MADADVAERKYERRQLIWPIVGSIIVADIALLVSGYRILLSEKVSPAPELPQKMIDVGEVSVDSRFLPTSRGTLRCRYFTGRGVKTVHLPMTDGVDECPFVYSPKEPA